MSKLATRFCPYPPELVQSYHDAIIPAMRYIARSCGYALAVHGSLGVDIDVLLVPWIESAADSDHLIDAIFKLAAQIWPTAVIDGPVSKPQGRVAYSLIPCPGAGPYFDISIIKPIFPSG